MSARGTSEGSAGALANPVGSRITSIGARYVSGSGMYGSHFGVGTATFALAANTSYYYKYWWPYGWTPSQIGAEITGVVAASKLKLALYQLNNDDTIGARMGVTGDLSGAALGLVTAAFAPGALWTGPGLYVFGLATDSAISVRWHSANVPGWPYRTGTVGPIGQLLQAVAYASALPSPGPAMTALSVSSAAHVFGLLGAP